MLYNYKYSYVIWFIILNVNYKYYFYQDYIKYNYLYSDIFTIKIIIDIYLFYIIYLYE